MTNDRLNSIGEDCILNVNACVSRILMLLIQMVLTHAIQPFTLSESFTEIIDRERARMERNHISRLAIESIRLIGDFECATPGLSALSTHTYVSYKLDFKR